MTIEEILDYVTKTPGNTNRAVLRSMIQSLGTDSKMYLNIIGFEYHIIENTNLVECIIGSNDITESIRCTVHLLNVGESPSLLSTDWRYLNKEDEVPENIINYYNFPLLNYLPIEVYSALLQYVQDNHETVRTITTASHFTDSTSDSPVAVSDTPLQPPQEEEALPSQGDPIA